MSEPASYGGYGAGGMGGYGASRFDNMEPFNSAYRTPGWQRAQANRGSRRPAQARRARAGDDRGRAGGAKRHRRRRAVLRAATASSTRNSGQGRWRRSTATSSRWISTRPGRSGWWTVSSRRCRARSLLGLASASQTHDDPQGHPHRRFPRSAAHLEFSGAGLWRRRRGRFARRARRRALVGRRLFRDGRARTRSRQRFATAWERCLRRAAHRRASAGNGLGRRGLEDADAGRGRAVSRPRQP